MKRFWRWFKVGASTEIAGRPIVELAAKAIPVVGPLASTLIGSILKAEAAIGPGKGAEKRERALGDYAAALPVVLPIYESITGQDVDDEGFMVGVGKVIDGFVDIGNALNLLPTKKKEN